MSSPGLRQRIRAVMAAGVEQLDRVFESYLGKSTREERTFYALVPLVGLMGGALGLAVHKVIDFVRLLTWGPGGSLLEAAAAVPRWQVIAAPAAGGALVGLIVWLNRGRLSADGMGLLIEAVVLRRGRVPARPVLLGALGSIATVGAGGSLGREGPMIRLGATLSSLLGQRFGLGPHRLKILLGCGAAAGMAAAYNVPIGGALFAMEVILGNFALDILGPIVVAAAISTMVARTFEGNEPLYAAGDFALGSVWDLIGAAGMGIVGGLASLAFIWGVRGARVLFARGLRVPASLKPVVGMGLLGAVGLYVPHVLGSGVDSINLALTGTLPIAALLLLPVAKILATALTVGCGGTGGQFTPSLFVGAMLGGAFGVGFAQVFPAAVGSSGAWAAVGMAAMIAGTGHAPITAILMMFELTGSYGMILPLMIASIVASGAARWVSPYSAYTEALEKAGVDLRWRMEEAVLAGIRVRDVMRAETEALRPETPFPEIVERFLTTSRHRLFVVGHDDRLLGEVALHDVKPYLGDPGSLQGVLAHDLMHQVGETLDPEERLHAAAQSFAATPWERLAVMDGEGKLMGILAKRDLLAIYAQEVMGRPQALATFVSTKGPEAAQRDHVELPPDFSVRLVPVPAQLVGSTLARAELTRRGGIRVLELKRRVRGVDQRSIPEASTRLEAGDGLIVLGPSAVLDQLARGELPALESPLPSQAAEPGPSVSAEVELPPSLTSALVPVLPGLVGKTLADLQLTTKLGVRVLEVRRRDGDGKLVREPAGATTLLAEGDELVVFGPPAGVEALQRGAMEPLL
jgi:CIC family chloride channel protein